ncbi:hypothetical protein G7047_04855 [Diaphorobacter sp. HDW4A]|uniref:hypothetical protein n=1 Tax=Diaphorobacter sp. HDW4A TaxID=2714924 RepID=UPI00140D89C0|nr:hypothetical protein [Diaphorobacter sp. HDW4A]QIL79309.1 hypothetical protein G7047_04855 [Diaphorobacter sp. HDW4A]
MAKNSNRPRYQDVWIGLAIGLICFAVFNANLRSIGAADSYVARYLPLSIWKHHSLALEPIAEQVAQGVKIPDSPKEAIIWVNRGPNGNPVSLYPLVTPLLVTPLYLPAYLYMEHVGWHPGVFDQVARLMEKLSASLVASLTTTLLYLVLRRQSRARTAALLSLVFALGTSTWVISSQALWMHGVAQLLVTFALWLVTADRCNRWSAMGLGLTCALIACNRPPDALLAAGFAAYALVWARGHYAAFAAGALVPIALTLAYNLGMTGYVMGGYGIVAQGAQSAVTLSRIPEGIMALLISPVHGLFVFSPFLLLVVLRLRTVIAQASSPLLARCLLGAVAVQILFYATVHWTQGVSWGPRYLTDMLPILFWLLPVAIQSLMRSGRAVFIVACLASIAMEALGAFGYTGQAHAQSLASPSKISPAEMNKMEKRAAWKTSNAPFLSKPVFFNDLTPLLMGSIERAVLTPSGSMVVEGWTLLGGKAPYDLHLLGDGKKRSAATATFVVRPDVERSLGIGTPVGWRMVFPSTEYEPGRHVFTAMVRSHPNAQPRILPNVTFDLKAPPDNATVAPLQGSIDSISVHAGDTVDIAGWALAHGDTPAQVQLLFDGKPYPRGITTFFERPDVVQYTAVLAASGWRITLPARDLSPGEHVLTVLVLPKSGGKGLALPTAKLIIPTRMPQPPSGTWTLTEAAQYASSMLAHRQHADGYWLTEHTQSLQYRDAKQELNIFSNAEMLDILGPVAREAGAQEMLARARTFLSTQIEDSGLVRYHGRTDLATHGTISCRITPDADDTALVWRVASNGNLALQDRALATLQKYRTADGLYRTWLAPQNQYECIDPGSAPNPPDIGIQIHILLWLHHAYPAQAPPFCRALQKRAADERLWVYYQHAPAAIAMRLKELESIGCPLELPVNRLSTQVAGQQPWLNVMARIRQLQGKPIDPSEQASNSELLKQLAAHGFASITRDPLLFFHNDMSASVKRFYWSRDMGYALWLRLYHDNERSKIGGEAVPASPPRQGARS